ncbi:MAG: hypothetical protein EAY81_00280, partial [Bacteroidetes bacterium]
HDVGTYLFTFGLFFTFFFLFAKFFPVINMAEVKAVLKEANSKVYRARRTVVSEPLPSIEEKVIEKESH